MTAATAPYPAPQQVKRRPLGITIIAILEFLFGIAFIIIAIGLFVGGTVLAVAGGFGPLFAGFVLLAGIIVLIVGLLFLILGWGLWKGRRWAWSIAFVLGVIAIIFGIIGLVGGNLGDIIGIVIQFIILYYLWLPGVKDYFRSSRM